MATTGQRTNPESLGGRHSHAIYGIVVFWQTFVNGHIFAVPRLVEEGAKSEDLQHGAEQSSLFDSLRLGENAIKIPQGAMRDRIALIVPFNATPSFLR